MIAVVLPATLQVAGCYLESSGRNRDLNIRSFQTRYTHNGGQRRAPRYDPSIRLLIVSRPEEKTDTYVVECKVPRRERCKTTFSPSGRWLATLAMDQRFFFFFCFWAAHVAVGRYLILLPCLPICLPIPISQPLGRDRSIAARDVGKDD